MFNHPHEKFRIITTDHFTKFFVADPSRNETARVTAEAIFIISFYVIPKLHSDQDTNFCSNIFKEYCIILGIYKSKTTWWVTRWVTGATERFTQLSMIGTLENSWKANLKSHINTWVELHGQWHLRILIHFSHVWESQCYL